jgi:TDG/mug DNA glycosylase family protein
MNRSIPKAFGDTSEFSMNVLPDVLIKGLDIVFCGTAAGNKSAREGAYYADSRNVFWRTLFEVGLTPYLISPKEYQSLTAYGLGLTDLAKSVSGVDSVLSRHDFDREGLEERILRFQPRLLAFTSKEAAKEFLGIKAVEYGLNASKVGDTRVFVLPSPSGAAKRSWNIQYWHDLSDLKSKS